jgi:hypothetical protein
VKRIDRDESICVVILICIETTQGNSLLAIFISSSKKYHISLFIFYVFFLLQYWRTGGWNRFCPGAGMGAIGTGRREEVAKGVGG